MDGYDTYIVDGTNSGTTAVYYYDNNGNQVYVNPNGAAGDDLSEYKIYSNGETYNALSGDVNIEMTGGSVGSIVIGYYIYGSGNDRTNVNVNISGGSCGCVEKAAHYGNSWVFSEQIVPMNQELTGYVTKTDSGWVAHGDAIIPEGKTVTVGEGEVFQIESGATLTNNGTIVNNGTINTYAPLNVTVTGNGTVVRNAICINDTASSITVYKDGEEYPAQTEVVDGKTYIYVPAGEIKVDMDGDVYYAKYSAEAGEFEPESEPKGVTDFTNMPTEIKANEPFTLSAGMVDEWFNTTVTYAILDDGGTDAVLDGNVLTAYGAGTIQVTVTAKDTYDYTFSKTYEIVVAYTPVSDIETIPSRISVGINYNLEGYAVTNNDATYKTVEWSVVNANGTGATITDNVIKATSAGTAVIRATVRNGQAYGEDYHKEYTIEFYETDEISVANGSITISKKDENTVTITGGGLVEAKEYPMDEYITIIGTTDSNTITISEGTTANVILSNVSISSSNTPIDIQSGATLNLTLLGENTLTSADKKAALHVPSGAKLVITDESTGSLNATGGHRAAGIGGNHEENSGDVEIHGGTITAKSPYQSDVGGAGIGGGYGGSNGSVTITGGYVNASSANGGAGIGAGYGWSRNGGKVTITGGTVIANGVGQGTRHGAGIGGGHNNGDGGNVVITGGNVQAIAGDGAEAIGKGNGSGSSGTLKDSAGNDISLIEITLDGVSDKTSVTNIVIDGSTYGSKDVVTIGDKLYLYLPADTMPTSVTAGGNTYICNVDGTFYQEHNWVDATCFSPKHCTQCEITEGIALSHNYENGVCTYCGMDENGVFHIKTAEQLVAFAQYVELGNKDADAVLDADIDMTGVAWTPICQTVSFHDTAATDTGYSGTFDGNGHTISNLTVTGISGGTYSYGLFGTVSGTVENLGMVNYTYTMGSAPDARAGSIAGQVLTGGTITNCYSVGHTVKTNGNIAGGIAGCNYGGTISNCYAISSSIDESITGHGDRWGGVVGDCQKDDGTSGGTVSNCYTNDTRVVSSQSGNATITSCAVMDDAAFASGEITYLLNGSSSGNVTWYQTLETDTYPVLDSEHDKVYSVFKCNGTTPVYRNINENEPHTDENPVDGKCDVCGITVHTHEWTYTANDDTITAVCGAADCPLNGAAKTIVISASDKNYDGIAVVATVENNVDTTDYSSLIVYKDSTGTEVDGAINVGVYTANLTIVNEDDSTATASCQFKITKATSTAEMFTYTAPKNLVYDGNVKSADVTIADNITGMGEITNVKYYQDDTEVAPINVGTYTVKIDVAEGDNYTDIVGLEIGTFEITKADAAITWDDQSVASTGEEAVITAPTLEFFGNDNPEVELTYSYKAQGDAEYTTGLPTACGIYDVKVNVSATDNYNAVEDTMTLTITCTDADNNGICDHCGSYDEPERVDEYYHIANAGNLMWFAQQVNEGKTTINAMLTADIDMKDIDWTTMSSFAGTLDGNGHTILYLCADESDGDDDIADGSRCGLFQTLSVGGTVTNLTISGAQLWSAHSAGAIAAVNNGTISKCIVKDSSIMLGQSHGLAAIAGTNTGTVTDCGAVNCFLQRRYGAANSSTYAIGAVVEDNSGTVSNCFSYGCRFSNSPNIYAVVESGNTPVNCYYYTDATVSDTVATSKTAEAFASGEVAYLLNGSSSENVTWYQKLLTDTYPVLDSKHGIVYSVFKCDGTTPAGYSNENKNEPHVDEALDGVCDACQARFAYKVAASSKLLGKGTSVADISMNPVNGYVKSGESITVTAQDKLEFVGWYLPSDMNEAYQIKEGRTALSTELTYTFVPSEDVTLVAVYDKHTPTITVGTASYAKLWGDENFKLDVSHNNSDADAALTYSSSDEDVATVDTNGIVTIKGIGQATLTVSMAESTNYYAAVDKTIAVTVNKATAPTLANASMTYIYAQSKTGENVTIKGIPGDCGKATYRISSVEDDSEMLANVSVADGTVTYDVKALDSYNESDSATIKVEVEMEHYETAIYTLTISRTDKLVQEISAENVTLTYGGNGTDISVVGAKTPLTYTVMEDSVENGDVITVDADGKVNIANAGTAKVKIIAEESDVYAGAFCEIIVTVTKAELIVAGVSVQGRVYDGTNTVQITGVTLNGVVAGDEVAVNVEKLTGTLSDKVAGEYTSVTLPELTLTGADADNYVLTQPTEAVSTQVTISKAKAVITTKYDSYTRIYNDPAFSIAGDITTVGESALVYSVSDGVDAEGKAKAASEIVTVSKDGVVTVAGSGSVKVSLNMAESANYEAAETKTITIQVLAWDDASRDGFFVKAVSTEKYTGKAIKPEPEVWDGNGELCLEKGRDYTISYKNNKNAYTLKEGEEGFNAKKAPTMIIKGKGNYDQKLTVYFTIQPRDIANLTDTSIEADDILVEANGKVQKKSPVIKVNGKKLGKNDFTVTYPALEDATLSAVAYKEPGIYPVVITGKGNYTGSRAVNLIVAAKGTSLAKASIAKIPAQEFDGVNAVELDDTELVVTAKINGKKETLKKGVHYTVEYANNKAVGTATVTVKAIEESGFAGFKKATFKVNGTSIAKATVEGVENRVYSGSAQKLALKITASVKDVATGAVQDVILTEGTDYKVAYSKNTNVGTATVTITGMGRYTGTIKKSFKITAADMADIVTAKDGQLTAKYVKGGAKPSLNLVFNGKKLTEGRDYTVTYKNNKAVYTAKAGENGYDAKKAPAVTIKGKGNFAGSVSRTYTITGRSLADTDVAVTMSVADKAVSDKKGGYISKVVITDADGTVLKEGTDYSAPVYTMVNEKGETVTLTKEDTAPVGSVITVSVTGLGAYEDAEGKLLATTYRITAKDFAKVKVAGIQKKYTGKAVELTAADFVNEDGSSKVTIGGESLVYGKDFEIVPGSYKDNVKKGTATVTIRGCGEYGGTKTVKFSVGARSLWFWWL
ncbi:MAG: hypothetical protein E7292_04950 [Lachnospiraceae bacterium]|nr:hypothetical protein [Lachnospiraceae bacterium]